MCSLPQTGITLKVLLSQADGCWIAKCVDFDVLTAHRDRETAFRDIQDLCAAHILHACDHDANLDHLFRPINQDAVAKMAYARDEGDFDINLKIEDESKKLTFKRLAAAVA